MKLSKEDKKELEIKIKELLKRYGFKGSRGCMYKTDKKVYIRVLYLIAESKRLVISVYVKNYSYDNFFWRIMNMRENESQGDSFRANGAFISPGILIKKIIHEFTEGYLEQLEGIVDEVVQSINNFIHKNNINNYVFSHDDTKDGGDLLDGSILKCLAYCDIGKLDKAKEVAIYRIEHGDTGRFESEGKGFFEWIISFEP